MHPPVESPTPLASGAPCAGKSTRLALLLVLVPLVLLGPSLLPGKRFLPLHPAGFEPLASERADPGVLWRRPNYLAADRVFPQLTDQFALREQVLGGHLPTWEPRLGLGAPLFAGTMAGALYPPNWIQLAVSPDRAAGWLALLALTLAGWGAWQFLRHRGLAPGPCLIGALAYQVGGYAVANLHDLMKVDAALWLPWQLAAIEAVLAGERRAGWRLSAVTALPLLAGFPPIAIFGLAVAVLYAAWRWIETARNEPTTRAGRRPLRALLLGVLLAAIQLVPTTEASLASLRTPKSADELAAQSLPIETTAAIVLPDLFGAPDEATFAPHLPAAWWLTDADEADRAMTANPLEWNLFAGACIVLLALAALVGAPRQALPPLVLLLAAIGYAQGWPLVRALYRVPGLNLGAPARAISIAWFAWAWLAALGAAAGRAHPRRALLATTLGGLLLATVGLGLRMSVRPAEWPAQLERDLSDRHGVAVEEVRRWVRPADAERTAERIARSGAALTAAALAAIAAGLVALRLGKRGREGTAWVPWVLVIAGEGLAFSGPHLAPRAVGDLPAFPPSAAIDAVARAAGDGRVVRYDATPGGVADVERLARPNLLQPYGISDLTPYVVFPPRYAVELLEALDPRTRWRTGAARLPDLALLAHPVLDLLRVTAVLSREPLEHPRLRAVLEQPGFCVYERAGAYPPARVVPTALPVASDELALGQLRTRVLDPARATVLAPGADVPPAPPPAGEFRPGAITIDRPGPNRLDLHVAGSSGGWLVVHEGWAPGWKATVNGTDAEVVRADHAFRALLLPPGDCDVRMWYEPWSLRIGAGLSLVALLAAAWLDRRPRRTQ